MLHRYYSLLIRLLLCACTLSLSAQVFATKDDIYTSWLSNVAVGGYDTVAYFTNHKALKGSKKYQYTYLGVTWKFISKEHLDTFKKNPEAYRPQYGGHCAYAVAEKKSRVSANPKAWKIVNNKLYLNYDFKVQQIWENSYKKYIPLGDKNWKEMTKNNKDRKK